MQVHVEAEIDGTTVFERLGGVGTTSATVLAFAAVLAVPLAARASPAAFTADQVRELVTRPDCGGVDDRTPEGALLREHLVAKVRQESGFNPFAIRVEEERRAITTFATEDDAVREATRRLEAGQTLGLGFGQITHKDNLARDFGVPDWRLAVRLAFQSCRAIRAMVGHYAGNIEQAARVLDCASGAYWSGRVACGTPYARSIAAIRAALARQPAASPPVAGAASPRPASPLPPPRSESLHDAVHVHRPAAVSSLPLTEEHTTREASLPP